MHFVFFGSSEFSVLVLEELRGRGLLPDLLVTTPDKPAGRKLVLTPNAAKKWAMENGLKWLEFKSLKDPSKNPEGKDAVEELNKMGEQNGGWDFFLVASYGRIIPPAIFNIPKHQTLNIHPSLLPKYRGASPMKSQILNDAGSPGSEEKEVGTTIMVIDEGMDTGPIIAQKKVAIPNWPVKSEELEKIMSVESTDLFMSVINKWLAGELEAKSQPTEGATECGKIEKEDGLLNLEEDARKNLLKIKAFSDWPRAYYFHNGKRIIVTDAEIIDGKLEILKVIPEGKREMSYADFLRGQR